MWLSLLLPVAATSAALTTNRVSVSVCRQLAVPAAVASDAWLDYTWTDGGGLPVLALPQPQESKRLVLPLGLEETLDPSDDALTRRYRVTCNGLISSEMVDATHCATVSFVDDDSGGCELVWDCEFEVQHRQRFWQAVTDTLIGQAADNLQRHLLEPMRPRWFAPLSEFGPVDSAAAPSSELPLLLVLPGLDGSGITAWTQYPELGSEYEVRALEIPAGDRSAYEEIVHLVAAQVSEAATTSAGREVILLGESMGAGIALDVSRRCADGALSGLVLVSPATSWGETALGRNREWLVELPAPALTLVIALSSYQVRSHARRATGCVRIFGRAVVRLTLTSHMHSLNTLRSHIHPSTRRLPVCTLPTRRAAARCVPAMDHAPADRHRREVSASRR